MAQAHRIKPEQPAIRAGIFRFLKGTLQEIIFWLVVVIALGMILALASFHIDDPAWTHTANVAKMHNLVGTAGAWFADINLYFFGYPAYWLPLSLLFAAWRLFRKGSLLQLDAEIVLFRVLGFAVALAMGCGLAALHLRPLPGTVPGAGSAGGLMGAQVGQFLTQAFGYAWGNLFMIALLLAGVTLSTGFSWLKLVDWIGNTVLRSADKLKSPEKPPRRGRPSTGKAGGDARPKAAAAPDQPARTKPKSGNGPERSMAAGLSSIAAMTRAWWRERRERREATEADARGAASAEPASESDAGSGVAVTGGWQGGRIEPVLDLGRERKGRGGARHEPSKRAAEAPPSVSPDLTLVPSKFSAPGAASRQPLAVSEPLPSASGESAHQLLWTADVDYETEASNDPMRPKAASVKIRPAAPAAGRPTPPGLSETGALPALDLLDQPPPRTAGYSLDTLQDMSRQVEVLLKSFGVDARVVAVEPGPVITRFEVDPAPGVKVSQISNLAKDLARGLSVISVRVVEVIPGKSFIGLEIPNRHRETVYLREVLEAPVYAQSPAALTLALGMDIGGNPVVANLARMPHLLVAGTTGSGKSVAINAMLLSLLYKAPPSEVRLILVDPKMLELSMYEDIPHLLTPVVTDMKEAANALRWCVGEMDRRYRLMAALKVRNIAGFNRKVSDALEEGEGLPDPLWKPEAFESECPLLEPLPFIVVVIDELADMMMIVGKKVEELIARLAQKARASGIHLILATQRPSVDVITGLIKANIPTRIAFQVSSKVDSRTILDQMGAEQLLGHGDMLYLPPGTGLPQRVHGAFVDDQEVNRVVDFLRETGAPDYIEDVLVEPREEAEPGEEGENGGRGGESDPLYDEAVRIVVESRRASVSGVQRRLRIGYNRAARLVEEMEAAGVVGPLQSNGSREVLAPAPP